MYIKINTNIKYSLNTKLNLESQTDTREKSRKSSFPSREPFSSRKKKFARYYRRVKFHWRKVPTLFWITLVSKRQPKKKKKNK